ncbi:MAG: DUF1836 domain-containing protein, partial [Defluviitaleaceae bacterium]|nr:DUF1836 domain-containing protein [Defluviitaleaceae bacterium]
MMQNIDILKNIENYTEEMTISQVIAFFERNRIYFTKTMIQNYVRVSVLSPLHNKRYYKKEHLCQLVMINDLKDIYSLEEIRACFDSYTSVEDAYNEYIKLYKNALDGFENTKNKLAFMAISSAALKKYRGE